jgi:hypothetical protein
MAKLKGGKWFWRKLGDGAMQKRNSLVGIPSDVTWFTILENTEMRRVI